MNIIEAVKAAEQGKPICRRRWDVKSPAVQQEVQKILDCNVSAMILAEDWYVVQNVTLKTLTFAEAVETMKTGKKVTRLGYNASWRDSIVIKGNDFVWDEDGGLCYFNMTDIEANDWIIVENNGNQTEQQ